MKKLLTILFVFMSTLQLMAQSEDVEMATGLRSSGKIYVVVLIVSVIFIGLAIYLFSIDRRVKKLEKEN
ncbi:MAG TPA: CcmD family protein [Sphingobacteriaceae bacterium]|nr:CcmD family protein [Sphingobacteriaceae bacterium]